VGPGGHGRLTTPEGRLATEAARRVADYMGRVQTTGKGWSASEVLDSVAVAEERLLSGLRTVEGVRWPELGAMGLSSQDEEILLMVEQGLVLSDTDKLTATPRGRLLLDHLVARLAG
jgi:oxygen-independent coproporphyrinogen-3 oxidase